MTEQHNARFEPTHMWFLACPPVRDKNPSWAPNEIYVFERNPAKMQALESRLPDVALLATESNVRGQLMRTELMQGTLAQGVRRVAADPTSHLLIPVRLGAAFNGMAASAREQADEVVELAHAAAGRNIIFALPGPMIQRIYNALGAEMGAVKPYSLRRALYDPLRQKIEFIKTAQRVPVVSGAA